MPTYVLSKVKRTSAVQKIGDLGDLDIPTAALDDTTVAAGDLAAVQDVSDTGSPWKQITLGKIREWLETTITVGWSRLSGVPTTFAPSAHTHPVSEVTGVMPVSKGGTGATDIATLRTALSLGSLAEKDLEISTSAQYDASSKDDGTVYALTD